MLDIRVPECMWVNVWKSVAGAEFVLVEHKLSMPNSSYRVCNFVVHSPVYCNSSSNTGDQPTALQLVMDDVTYIGKLTESTAYWAAIASIIGIIICLISTIATANGITCFVSVLTELPLVLALYDMIKWADDAEELFEALGIGFWGVFILLWIVVFARSRIPLLQQDRTNIFCGVYTHIPQPWNQDIPLVY